jgi:hypothetical protein
MNLPTWESLLFKFFEQSLIEGDIEYFQSKSNGNLPLLASKISEEFHEIWWKKAAFSDSRKLYKSIAKAGKELPFKIEISVLIKKLEKENRNYVAEIALLGKLVVDGIITTNWDQFLEKHFPEYTVFIGQQELLFSQAISIGEIYKIHGCVSKPESLITTEADYQAFTSKNAYLAAKLLTIFVEHPIIFLGYSLADENIQQIIDSIVRCVEPQNLNKLKDRLIFVEWVADKKFEIKDSSIKLLDNKVLPIKLIQTDSFLPILETLSILKRKIPVKILRKLKNSVSEFVKTNNPTQKIYIQDLDTLTEESNIEYAIGVGVATKFLSSQGYTPIETIDVIEDILYDNKHFDELQLIDKTFPKICKGNAYIPIYKYLNKLNFLDDSGNLNTKGGKVIATTFKLRENPPSCFYPTGISTIKRNEIRRNHKSVSSIVTSFDLSHSLNYIALLDIKNIDSMELRNFLRICFQDIDLKKSTGFRKLVCFYDYHQYGLVF